MAPKSKQIETMEHVPASEHGGGFPPFQKDTFASQLLWITLAFVALYLLMSRVALPRIGSIIEDRKQRIASDFAEAERMKAEFGRGFSRLREIAGRCPWPGPGPCQRDPRTRGQGRRERPQGARRQAQYPDRRGREDDRGTPVGCHDQRPGHCGRRRCCHRRAPDRLGTCRPRGRGRRRRRAQALRIRCSLKPNSGSPSPSSSSSAC